MTYEVEISNYEVATGSYEVAIATCEVVTTTYEIKTMTCEVARMSYEVVITGCEVATGNCEVETSIHKFDIGCNLTKTSITQAETPQLTSISTFCFFINNFLQGQKNKKSFHFLLPTAESGTLFNDFLPF